MNPLFNMDPKKPDSWHKAHINKLLKDVDMQLALRYDAALGKEADLCDLIPVCRGHQLLVTEMINHGFEQVQAGSGLQAVLRDKLPIIDFIQKGQVLSYHAMIDNQGLVVLVETFDNNESFKILSEIAFDIRVEPVKAAAEVALFLVASIEAQFMAKRLQKKGWYR